MMSLPDDTQADAIEAFKSTSRYLDDLLNTDNPYFEGMSSQIYPAELHYFVRRSQNIFDGILT